TRRRGRRPTSARRSRHPCASSTTAASARRSTTAGRAAAAAAGPPHAARCHEAPPGARGHGGCRHEPPRDARRDAVGAGEGETAGARGGGVESGAPVSRVGGARVVRAEHVGGVVVLTGPGVFDLSVAGAAAEGELHPPVLEVAVVRVASV